MSSRHPLAALLLLVAAGCGSEGAAAGERRTPRNVILVSVDTLRADRLGCYGYERPTSPFLDELAEGGTLFERVMAQSPWTLPSHASLLTGLVPQRHGVTKPNRRLPGAVPTLAQVLADAGFATAAFVNSSYLGPNRGLHRGFATFELHLPIEHDGRFVAERALAWLEARGRDPFFVFLHVYDVHGPYDPDPEFRAAFVPPYDGPADGTPAQLKRVREGEEAFSAEDLAHTSHLYDAGIAQFDALLREVVAELEELGLREDTLLILTSDHGEEFLEHGNLLHGRNLHREVLDVPLILSGPGVPRGRRVAELATQTDVFPTVLALLGLGAPPDLDGRDLLADEPTHRTALAQADRSKEAANVQVAVTEGRFKLIHHRGTRVSQLYDLERDPLEREDVAAHHPEVAERLLEQAMALLKRGREGDRADPPSAEEAALLEELGYADG